MFRQHKALKTAISAIVIMQFGFLMPLEPVLAQEARGDDFIIREDHPAETEVGKMKDVWKDSVIENGIGANRAQEAGTVGNTKQVGQSDETSIENITKKQINYTSLMRGIKDLSGDNVASRQQVLSDFSNFIDQEKDHLDNLPVDFYKKGAYINRLAGQLKGIDDTKQSPGKQILEKIKDFFGFGVEELSFDKKSEQNQKEFKMPDSPAEFGFNQNTPKFEKISNITVPANQKINKTIKAFITIQEAKAVSVLPVLEDLKGDEHEIIINSTIRDLASDLNNNPVEIFNFVRENIDYEAYYGSKKGNLGCLEEKICNDVDTASLAISLMRASGIPAHYKKSIMVVSIEELQDLLGIEKTVEGRRTAYGILAWNKVPVFSITNNPTLGENLDGGDFTNETHFALEWVFPEIYYDYDERGGNIDNQDDLGVASTNEELNNLLQDKYKKQWLPLDLIFKNYNYAQKPIVADSANFDTESFWYNYLQYQGDLSPLKKYTQDLLNATGKDINNQTYQSTNSSVTKNYEILPPTLPYVLGEGVDGDGGEILPETWSALPDARKTQVKIQLKKADTEAVVLEHTFFGSEINNKELNLFYEGATQSDQQIIDSYGGIYATPAELVDIKAHFLGDNARYDDTEVFSIGDSMILRFEYYVKGLLEHDDEKFSTAGNQEGIYVVLSQVQEDSYLDTNSKILLRGNVGLAREYLRQVQESEELFEKSLDYNYNVNFSRAVVTQNRILNTVNGAPTTFDFKGLTIDAGTYINDWSNRGNYKTHRKDFRLLFGLESSYYEGQIFDNVAGLEGISTVTGLQYAYAHPADYTVHTIKSANESVIDSLALSDNTKANMHADVQKGNTIVTPNKFVTAGNWNGIFYISLDPVWTGTYAIGEQTGENGGWTVSDLLQHLYIDMGGKERTVFFYILGDSRYHFEDDIYESGVQCRIKNIEYDLMKASQDWNNGYGEPCSVDAVTFVDVEHSYMLATNGAYFYSPGKYGYWKSKSDVIKTMKQYISGLPSVADQYDFRFSTVLGTYLKGICSEKGLFKCKNSKYETVYYTPNDLDGSVYRLKEGFLDKANKDNNKVIKILGFPTSDESVATPSQYGTTGVYQNFVNGQMYYYKRWGFNWIYYTYGKIADVHNSQNGTAGALGFPEDDPNERNNHVYQEFEGDNEIGWNLFTGQTLVEKYKKYRCELYKNINDPVRLGLITVHGVWDTGVQTLDDFGSLVVPILKGVINLGETSDAVYNLYKEAMNIDIGDVKTFLVSTGKAAHVALGEEYDTSLGPNGCEARTNYLAGRITGEVLLIWIPASKLTAATKLKAINYAQKSKYGIKIAGMIGKWLEYKQGILDSIVGLVVPGKFEKEGIEHTLLGKINEATGNFQGKGFHSPRSLKNIMDNSIWDVAGDKSGSKIYKKISDLPVDKNGVRDVWIKKTMGFEHKSFFPDDWSDDDIVNAIVEASSHPTVDNEFFSYITKKGKTVPVGGFFTPGTTMIDTGFPIFTP